nr:lytic transglycosylase domain-containing protein [Brevundimonas diminuta]
MVRVWLAAAFIFGAPAAASAQPIDWSRAGGDLFGLPLEGAEALQMDGGSARVISPNQPFNDAVAAAAEHHNLDPKLLHALVLTESAYRTDAVSSAGAAGLTQLMPGTALDLGVADRFDPVENLRGGADYLARQIIRFGDLRLALAAYNSGPARVARLGRVPDIAETRAYVATVIDCYLALTAGRSVMNSRQCQVEGGRP